MTEMVYVLNMDGRPLMPTTRHGKVRFQNQECFIFGRRSSGYFDIRRLDGTKVSAGISYKKLELLEARKSILSEERSRQFLSHL